MAETTGTPDESLFRRLVTSAHDAIVTKTVDGAVTTWNAGAERLFGYAQDEMIGRPITTIVPPDRVAEEVELLARIRGGQVVNHFETVRLCKDGRCVDVSVTLSPIRDEAGQIIGASKIARDLTHDRDRAARLHRFTAALNTATTPEEIAEASMRYAMEPLEAEVASFTMLSEDGRDILTEHSIGISERELIGLRKLPITTEIGAAIAIREGKPFLATSPDTFTRRFAAVEWISPYRGGSRVSVPALWEGRAIASINLGFSAWREISAGDLAFMDTIAGQCAHALQRARSYAAERTARALAERNMRLRENMLAIVSHDLRNPLSSIVHTASSLANLSPGHITPGRIQKYAGSLQRSAEQMTRLIEDLLDLSSIDAGVLRIDRADHTVADVLGEALAMFRPLASERQIHLDAVVPADLRVHCDGARTVQVIGNLLSNAIKVTPAGGDVRVECSVASGAVHIAVRDTGPGIAEQDLPRLFDRYWRAEKQRYRGAGLGLAIARGIVEAQGGRIWVESKLGAGSTFYFTLPQSD